MANLKNTVISDAQFRLPVGDTAARPGSPNARQIRFNTETGKLEQFRPGVGDWIAPNNTGVIATGGDSVYDVDVEGTTYRVHVFTSTGTSTFNVLQGGEAEYLIVAGGGSGGNTANTSSGQGGGGGAGGLVTGFITVTPQPYTITVGAGGAGVSNSSNKGNNGEDTTALGLTAIGGGAGGGFNNTNGNNGGSGGGAGTSTNDSPNNGGNALQPNSTNGGFGNNGGQTLNTGTNGGGAGGGGAGGPGGTGDGNASSANGGIGFSSNVSGIWNFYAGGGASGSYNGPQRFGGIGGGGAGEFTQQARSGTPNTGGGGGGAASNSGPAGSLDSGAGGSGIVIIRYPLRQENPVTAPGRAVGDGLVLDLDFAKPTVYAGSGSVVTDGRLNGVEGNLINGPSFVDPRTHRSAFDFDGSNDYIQGTLTNPGGEWIHSITFWMNMNQDQSSISSRQDPFQIGNNASTSQYSALDISNNNINWYFYSNDTRVSSNLFNANVWYYIALTYAGGIANNTNKKFYVNGTNIPFDTSGSATLNIAQNANFTLGRDNQRTTAHFNGKIAVFKVYNRSLSSDEVQSIYNATRWRFGV